MMGAGVLFIWVLSFAATALLARAIPFGVREKGDPAWTANLQIQGNAVVAIAPATMAVTLFLLVRAERRLKRSQEKNEKIEAKVIPRERLWRAVFGGIFFLGLGSEHGRYNQSAREHRACDGSNFPGGPAQQGFPNGQWLLSRRP